MAQRPLKPCKYIGCKNLHRNSSLYCDEHEQLVDTNQRLQRRARFYERVKRGEVELSDIDKFYSSGEWQDTRRRVRDAYQGFCLNCLDNYRLNKGLYTPKPATTVHHIVELLVDWDLRLDADNLIPLCYDCHRGIHILYKTPGEKLKTQTELKNILKYYRRNGVYVL